MAIIAICITLLVISALLFAWAWTRNQEDARARREAIDRRNAFAKAKSDWRKRQ